MKPEPGMDKRQALIDEFDMVAGIHAAYGSASEAFKSAEVGRLLAALAIDLDKDRPACIAALEAIGSGKPADQIESVLIGEMVVMHGLSLRQCGRAVRAAGSKDGSIELALAIKAARTVVAQIEALVKLRASRGTSGEGGE